MNPKAIVSLVIIGTVLVLGFTFTGCVFSFRSDCIRSENGIEAQLKANKASHDTMWKTIKEVAQVPNQMKKDFIDVYEKAMRGRYGNQGSKAVFQWLKEQNPKLSPSVYKKVQTVIEANRARFLKDQQALVDKVRAYKDLLGSTTAIFANKLLGFPRKVNPDDPQYQPITSGRTSEAFRKGGDSEVDIFGNKK